MSTLRNYFGLEGTAEAADSGKTTMRVLPASWYTSLEMFELEKRAIFSKKWLLTTHKIRLPNAGDWVRYDVAGFPFILVKDRQGNINAFHNVCRHRAFPVVTEEKGTSRIFSCKYHGWSYGLNGKLAKAPGYQDLRGFDKSKNGLLPIHVHIDDNGFIWVNMDGAEQPESAWEGEFGGIDRLERYASVDWEQYDFDHTWEMEGEYNWKILADNYNEYCPTAQPDVPSIADLKEHVVETREGGDVDFAESIPEHITKGLKTTSAYYFPNVSMTVTPHLFFIQRAVPTSPTKCTMRYEVYRNKTSSDEDFQLINQMYKRIMTEEKSLCDQTQENLNNGVSVDGGLHPGMEKGSLYFQTSVRELVQEHYEREQAAGHDIWPARQALPQTATTSKDDMDFCSKLDASSQGGRDCTSTAGQDGGCSGMSCQLNEALAY
ncbi:Rieske [2Fe-2S] domain protein [Aspergillus terreus]|uniref:Choline monooxygenase, chloroplastic n=1 Tax=Aspergillus terreus TaxID=33178 RepID=A0A5M3Z7V3_ASPTE|nr:hypothetical protein ATETN484_0011012400 [Aspergillus terreus]GFF18761.1 Rieske [2Fe-2S] domain protein [Aspergillus terreus]